MSCSAQTQCQVIAACLQGVCPSINWFLYGNTVFLLTQPRGKPHAPSKRTCWSNSLQKSGQKGKNTASHWRKFDCSLTPKYKRKTPGIHFRFCDCDTMHPTSQQLTIASYSQCIPTLPLLPSPFSLATERSFAQSFDLVEQVLLEDSFW